MARISVLGLVIMALGLIVSGASVSRSATISLTIPPITVLSIPERELSGSEIKVTFAPEDWAQGYVLLPLEVKSNVPWAVVARVLSEDEDPVSLLGEVLGGPEVVVTTEEVPILTGRPGKHEVLLVIKLGEQVLTAESLTLVLRVAGEEFLKARRGERG